MFQEIAQLQVKPGHEAAFEADFAKAAPIIRRAKGNGGVELRRSAEHPNRYWLLVKWETVENHIVDFVNSDAVKEAGALLMPHVDGEPVLEHARLIGSY